MLSVVFALTSCSSKARLVEHAPFELENIQLSHVLPGVAGAPAGLELSFSVTRLEKTDIQFKYAYFKNHRIPLRIQARQEGMIRLKAFLPDDAEARNLMAEMGNKEERDPVMDSELVVLPLEPGTAYISYQRAKHTYLYRVDNLPEPGKRILQ